MDYYKKAKAYSSKNGARMNTGQPAKADLRVEPEIAKGSLALKAMGVGCGCACQCTGGATQLLWICGPMYWPQQPCPYADVDAPAEALAARESRAWKGGSRMWMCLPMHWPHNTALAIRWTCAPMYWPLTSRMRMCLPMHWPHNTALAKRICAPMYWPLTAAPIRRRICQPTNRLRKTAPMSFKIVLMNVHVGAHNAREPRKGARHPPRTGLLWTRCNPNPPTTIKP
jgi:hypothetical protein